VLVCKTGLLCKPGKIERQFFNAPYVVKNEHFALAKPRLDVKLGKTELNISPWQSQGLM
jgi:hypothetical protein